MVVFLAAQFSSFTSRNFPIKVQVEFEQIRKFSHFGEKLKDEDFESLIELKSIEDVVRLMRVKSFIKIDR